MLHQLYVQAEKCHPVRVLLKDEYIQKRTELQTRHVQTPSERTDQRHLARIALGLMSIQCPDN